LNLVVVGLSQGSAPLSVRERVAFAPARIGEALARLRSEVEEGLILSTCNRSEVYAAAADAVSGVRRVTAYLARWHGMAPETLEPYLYAYTHEAAARHLFGVVSGLESMVLGEDQIVAQTRAALAEARSAGTIGPRLERLGAAALGASKRVRHETAIGRSPTSVVSVALRVAEAQLGGLDGRAVVVVGAGRTGETIVKVLASLAPGAAVTVVNRSAVRAEALARRFGVAAAPWSELAARAATADLLVCATTAPCIVLGVDDLAAAAAQGRELVCLDLAVPRDIDPAAGAIPGVTIHDMDVLQRHATANRDRRAGEVAAAEAILTECVAQFCDWWRAREAASAITRLRSRAEALRDAELERALARMPGLDPAGQAVVRALAARLVNKLLHEPLTNVKEDADGGDLAVSLERLFTPRRRSSRAAAAPHLPLDSGST
jgi:glutamyl-tRNA reductase